MSTVIHSINYLFNPDKNSQALCEHICRSLDGNGISLQDITATQVSHYEVTVTSEFTWAIEVSLKGNTLADKYKKNTQLHKTQNEAQLLAKKQGQHVLRNSLGKIELVKNINEDPVHYFKHSTIKLNGGPAHGFVTHCSQGCDNGELICPRCKGKGTHKATTKKEDFLGTSNNFSPKNICPQCKGKGRIACSTCAGSGMQTHLYQVHVNASRSSSDSASTDTRIKPLINSFLKRISHEDLVKYYIDPTVTQLNDIDEKHCKVTYQAKTQALVLTIKINNKEYNITGFGKQARCIDKPEILDDILPPAIENIFGISTAINSTHKCMQLKNMPILQHVLEHDYDSQTEDKAAALLHTHSDNLLSKTAATSIIKQLADIKKHLTPRYSLTAWLPFTILGMFSAIYFGLFNNSPGDTAIIASLHLLAGLSLGYFSSKQLTQQRRKKLKKTHSVTTLERLPAGISAAVIIAALFIPKAFSDNQRWDFYFSLQQYYHHLVPLSQTDQEVISNTDSIRVAQKHLVNLGYKEISESGDYDVRTDIAVKDFQQKLGIRNANFLDKTTMKWLMYYSVRKTSLFKSTD